MDGQAAGFWSYVRQDDADDLGRILGLADRVRAAYRLRQAEELALFLDRESLKWGDEWRARIDAAIAGTTFFIPVITPSYFNSPACRQELLKFAREAKRLGLEQLILPVYWVTVQELDENPDEASDEAIKVVARYQWQDFREVRLEDESSSVFRKAVDKLATDLAQRATQVSATVEDIPQAVIAKPSPGPAEPRDTSPGVESNPLIGEGDDDEADEDDDSPGILEKLATTEEAWPRITAIMESLGHEIESVGAITTNATERINAAEVRGEGIKARLVQTERMAQELSQPADEIERLGFEYAEALADLDPGLQALLDLAAEGDASDDDRAELLNSIQEMTASADEALTMLSGMLSAAAEISKLSRSLRSPLGRVRKGLQGVLDGRAVMEDWGRRARAIAESDRGKSDAISDETQDADAAMPSDEASM